MNVETSAPPAGKRPRGMGEPCCEAMVPGGVGVCACDPRWTSLPAPAVAGDPESLRRAKLHLIDCAAFVAGALYELERTHGPCLWNARDKATEATRTLAEALGALGGPNR